VRTATHVRCTPDGQPGTVYRLGSWRHRAQGWIAVHLLDEDDTPVMELSVPGRVLPVDYTSIYTNGASYRFYTDYTLED
jgi:hypothetical protein